MRLPSVAGTPMTPSRCRRTPRRCARRAASERRGVAASARRAVPVDDGHAGDLRPSTGAASGSDCSTFTSSCGVAVAGPRRLELRGDRAAEEDRHRREHAPQLQGDDAGQRTVGVTERVADAEDQAHGER